MARYIPKSNKSLIVLEEHLESEGAPQESRFLCERRH
jgi:hypothetical protein